MKDKSKKYEDKISTGEVHCPVFMFRNWSFHCNENGKVIEIYQTKGEELRCITIDDSTGECIISVD